MLVLAPLGPMLSNVVNVVNVRSAQGDPRPIAERVPRHPLGLIHTYSAGTLAQTRYMVSGGLCGRESGLESFPTLPYREHILTK
jgi:hypothetical protein